MIASEDALKEAVETYAVLMDRVQWLDPNRLDIEVRAWKKLVLGSPREGVVTVDDVVAAINELVVPKRQLDGPPRPSPREVGPPVIIDVASRYAAERRARAEVLVLAAAAGPDGELLPAEVQVWRSKRAQTDVRAVLNREATDEQLRRAYAGAVFDLEYSGLPDERTLPVMARLDLACLRHFTERPALD